jgi:hypothetical protein
VSAVSGRALRSRLQACTVALLMLLAQPSGAGEIERLTSRLPNVDPPPRGTAEWIAPSMRMNGVPMTIKSFTTALSIDEVFSHYESWWRGRGLANLRRQSQGDEQVFSINTGEHHISIQAREMPKGTQGTITVSGDLLRARREVTTLFPHPPSASVASLQEYEDAGVMAEHIDFISRRAVSNEAADFRGRLRAGGWEIVIDQQARSPNEIHVIEAQRGSELAHLVLQPGRNVGAATSIIVIWRKS